MICKMKFVVETSEAVIERMEGTYCERYKFKLSGDGLVDLELQRWDEDCTWVEETIQTVETVEYAQWLFKSLSGVPSRADIEYEISDSYEVPEHLQGSDWDFLRSMVERLGATQNAALEDDAEWGDDEHVLQDIACKAIRAFFDEMERLGRIIA